MKIKPEHFEYLSAQLKPHDTPENRQAYRAHNHSLTRYQWDMLHKAKLTYYMCDVLYPYLNDSHIQTALNHIIPSLEVVQEPLFI